MRTSKGKISILFRKNHIQVAFRDNTQELLNLSILGTSFGFVLKCYTLEYLSFDRTSFEL